METKFITVKVVESSRYRVEFQRCYEGSSRIHDNNRIVILNTSRNSNTPQMVTVSDDLGNHYYRMLKPWEDDEDGSWEFIFDSLFLNAAACREDYDAYSDIYKDMYNCRPHYSKEEWERAISTAKSLN